MRTDIPIKGDRNRFVSMISLLDSNPMQWMEYLKSRKINPAVAQRRINQLRASKAAALANRKADL